MADIFNGKNTAFQKLFWCLLDGMEKKSQGESEDTSRISNKDDEEQS